jgi:casein kinase 1
MYKPRGVVSAEEFSIYLNYVRKLGFEETPDYEFLRELFAKVMKSNGDVDDQIYDWNLLNGAEPFVRLSMISRKLIIKAGGKGWESSLVSNSYFIYPGLTDIHLNSFVCQSQSQILQQIQNTATTQRKDAQRDADRRRSQAGAGNPVPPSPALVRHGSKQQRIPVVLVPGGGNSPGPVTPLSAAAQVNIAVGTPTRRTSQQHPYANLAAGGYDYPRQEGDESYVGQEAYGRASGMVSSVGPPVVTAGRARATDIGILNGQGIPGDGDGEHHKPTLWKILTCRSC